DATPTTAICTLSYTTLFRSLTLGGVNDLADAEQRGSFGNLEQLGGLGVGGRGVYFFIGMRQLQAVFSLQQGKQRKFFHRRVADRSEEHTSELQSRGHLVCRL